MSLVTAASATQLPSAASLVEELQALGGVRPRFQPIVELDESGDGGFRLVGLECLTLGPAGTPYESAASLFAEARQRGEAASVDRLCIETALEAVAGLSLGSVLATDLFFNVHASTLEAGRKLPEALEERCAGAGVDMERIVVEVVEGEPMFEAGAFQTAVRALRAAGARIALDDVGQGFCTNRFILAARPDFLKLDRTLVQGAFFDSHRRALISSYRFLAEELGIGVIAEGVESRLQLEVLRRIGISLGQGYLFSASLEPREALEKGLFGAEEARVGPSPGGARE